MPVAVAIVVEGHTTLVIMVAPVASVVVPIRTALVAIVAANDIAGDSAKDRAGDRSTGAATGGGVAYDAAADRANRGSCVTTALAIRGFRRARGTAQRQCFE